MGENIGYIRVSTTEQNIERQLVAFEPFNINPDNVFIDKLSGKDRNRPALESMIKYARKGDVVYVKSFDRLGRNMIDVLQIVKDINSKGASLHIINGGYVYSGDDTPMMVLLMGISASIAEFERAMIRERSLEGIANAKLIPGKYVGRKHELTEDQLLDIKKCIELGGKPAVVARDFKISRTTIYKIINGCYK
jgi:DNA invertase Pin-like site-specific DNA recombinase